MRAWGAVVLGCVAAVGLWLWSSEAPPAHQGEPQVRVVGPDEPTVLKARDRARAELPAVAARFRGGLPAGAELLVKHGFPTPGGAPEYMWVLVTRWPPGGPLRGELRNRPEDAPLSLGQPIQLAEAGVFDWMIVHPDGHLEGGYTTAAVRALAP